MEKNSFPAYLCTVLRPSSSLIQVCLTHSPSLAVDNDDDDDDNETIGDRMRRRETRGNGQGKFDYRLSYCLAFWVFVWRIRENLVGESDDVRKSKETLEGSVSIMWDEIYHIWLDGSIVDQQTVDE